MTVSSTENRESYNGNGVTVDFAFPYRFLTNADLKVYVDDVLMTLTTDYTVAGAGDDSGGTVTMLVAPPLGTGNIVIFRDPSPVQELDLVENDPLPAEEVEKALDLLTMLHQRQTDQIGRTMRLSDSDTGTGNIVLPSESERANKILGFDDEGSVQMVGSTDSGILAAQLMSSEESEGSSLVKHLPEGTGAVARTVQSRLRDYTSVFDFLSPAEKADVEANTALVDVTAAVQAAIDATGLTNAEYLAVSDDYRRSKKKLYINDGTYLIGDLTIYQGTTIEWGPKAVFKLKSGATCGIKTVNYQGQTNPNFGVERVTLIRPRIDMDGNGTFGLLLQCLRDSLVEMPEVLNVPSGTANYDDGSGLGSSIYDKSGICLKGIDTVAGAYWNTIYMPRVKGVDVNGGIGIWLGTTSTGTDQRANHNRIIAADAQGMNKGIYIYCGGDNYIELPEVSSNLVGVEVGTNSGTQPCKRNHIKMPYVEFCTVAGVRTRTAATDTIIEGMGGTGGTTTPLSDNGAYTSFLAANTDSVSTNGFARLYYGSVRFPSVQVADADPNALDDYKEADFTPVIQGTTSAGAGTYTTQSGSYTKIGNRVFYDIMLTWTAHTGTGNLRVGGLPYTSRAGNFAVPAAVYVANIAMTAGNILSAFINSNNTTMSLLQLPSGGGAAANVPMDTAGTLHLSGHYTAA